MQNNSRVEGFLIPGYAPPGAYQNEEASSQTDAVPYKIPPAVWMVIFLLVGYFGLRMMMED